MGGAGDQGRRGLCALKRPAKASWRRKGLLFFLSKRQFTVHMLFTVFYSVFKNNSSCNLAHWVFSRLDTEGIVSFAFAKQGGLMERTRVLVSDRVGLSPTMSCLTL